MHTVESAKPKVRERSGTQFATFYVADLFFGIDVLDVQEVMRQQEMTPVPLAPFVIQGLINLRGQIVTAMDMRSRLNLPPRLETKAATNVVVRSPEGPVSLLVDEIDDVLEVDAEAYERPPENLAPAARELLRGIYKLNDRLLLVLDTLKTIEFPPQAAATLAANLCSDTSHPEKNTFPEGQENGHEEA